MLEIETNYSAKKALEGPHASLLIFSQTQHSSKMHGAVQLCD